MNFVITNCVLFSFFTFSSVLSQSCVTTDSNAGSTDQYTIDSSLLSCGVIYRTVTSTTGDLLAVFIYSGNLGDGVCTVYDGVDDTSAVLGTLAGDGDASGVVKSSGTVLSYYCVDVGGTDFQSSIVATFTIKRDRCVVEASGPPEVSSFEITSSNYPSNYDAQSILDYTFSSTYPCSYSFNFQEFVGDNAGYDTAYILSDLGGSRRVEGVLESFEYAEADGFEVKFQFITSSQNHNKGFQVHVSAECRPLPTEIDCSDTIQISVNYSQIPDFNLREGENLLISPNSVDSLATVNEKCIASPLLPTWTINSTDCNAIAVTDNGTLCLEFTVRRAREVTGIIQRDREPCIVLKCVFNGRQTVSSDIKPDGFKIRLEGDEAPGSVELKLNFYEDDTFMTMLPGEDPAVVINNYVYVEACYESDLLDTDTLVLQARRCWATRTDDPDEENYYSIIDDGCAADNPDDPDNAIEVFNNYDAAVATFSFLAFIWTDVSDTNQAIYVHCELELCESSTDDSCTTRICNRRRRRSSASSGDKRGLVVSSGPIRLVPENKETCLIDEGGCSHLCNMIGDNVVCSCPLGLVLEEDGKTCAVFEERNPSESGEESLALTDKVIIGVLVVFLLAVLASLYKLTSKRASKLEMSSA